MGVAIIEVQQFRAEPLIVHAHELGHSTSSALGRPAKWRTDDHGEVVCDHVGRCQNCRGEVGNVSNDVIDGTAVNLRPNVGSN